MALLTQAYLLETYGPRMSIEQLANALGIRPGTIYKQVSAQTFPIKTYTEGGKRYADYRDVAEYFDFCRQKAC